MADSEAFEHVCSQLERETSLQRLEARGTVRLVLKHAGLEARSVTSAQISVAISKVLPGELVARGIEDAEAVCTSIVSGLAALHDEVLGDTPEAIFQRLGGQVQ
jgi:hypothetical protein